MDGFYPIYMHQRHEHQFYWTQMTIHDHEEHTQRTTLKDGRPN
jgi:hypothetical protein